MGSRAGDPAVILYPKPTGVTSHDVVARVRDDVRKASQGKRPKVGHAGTLDPFATGLLIVLVGGATRTQDLFMGLDKTYRVRARIGRRSDTGDRDGVLTGGERPASLEIPCGPQLQRPPAYSAVKVDGERAYARARRGEDVEIEPRPVTVHDARLVSSDGDFADYEIRCSSGTYIRTLVSELGDAYCEELERTAIGPFRLDEADPERSIPLDEALSRLIPVLDLDDERGRIVATGGTVTVGELAPTADAPSAESPGNEQLVRLRSGGRLLAIARVVDGSARPRTVFSP